MSVATQIAALEAAIEKGVLEVEDENGRRVRYHSLREMIEAVAALRAAQGTAQGKRGFKITRFATSR